MTAAEAKRIIHPDTTVEALAEIEYYCVFSGKDAKTAAVDDACLVACAALDKQVPKKPYWEYGVWHCKSCGLDVFRDYAFCIPKCQMPQNSVNMISLCFTRLISRYRRSRYTCIKIIIAQFAKKMDGCYGMMLYPTMRTNIVANADRQLIGRMTNDTGRMYA